MLWLHHGIRSIILRYLKPCVENFQDTNGRYKPLLRASAWSKPPTIRDVECPVGEWVRLGHRNGRALELGLSELDQVSIACWPGDTLISISQTQVCHL